MHTAELEAWLRLGLTPRLGPVAFRKLLAAFGSPEGAIAATEHSLESVVGAALAKSIRDGPNPGVVADTFKWLDDEANSLLCLADDGYPKALLEIADPPPILYAKGDLRLLQRDAIAIVGSRNASPQGIANAEAFAQEISNHGFTIVSGLALGIDAAAHRGGLQGSASSVAVVATGLDTVYPARNRNLAHELAARGLLVSEFGLGTRPLGGNFPRRNRLISGLSRGVLVVEAALQSGSLITARSALEQGREVFAMPGSIHSPLSKGCHALIKQGAKLVESAADILDELGHTRHGSQAATLAIGDDHQHILLQAIGFDPVDLDTICARAGLTADKASAMLLELELEGIVARMSGGRYQRVR